MRDSFTRQPITVSTDGDSGLYIIVQSTQLQAVLDLLRAHGIPHSTDADAASSDGQTLYSVINLGSGAEVDQVQQVLDSVP